MQQRVLCSKTRDHTVYTLQRKRATHILSKENLRKKHNLRKPVLEQIFPKNSKASKDTGK